MGIEDTVNEAFVLLGQATGKPHNDSDFRNNAP
jgi:hypothetical protein